MKIISWNVNGIRAVYKKGFLDWLLKAKADIICLQEIKAQVGQIPQDLIEMKGYLSYFNSAVRPGYAGVAVYTKERPLRVGEGIGLKRFDQEGRVLHLKFLNFELFNLYLPHGGRQGENIGYKLEVYNRLLNHLKDFTHPQNNLCKVRPCKDFARSDLANVAVVLAGDFNVAHQEVDLARPKDNKNNTMFTLKERRQIDKIIELGFIDTFRKFHKEGGHYTWWPYFANARERNLGWRIDYIFTSKSLTSKLKNGFILPEVKGSDHCPIGVEIVV